MKKIFTIKAVGSMLFLLAFIGTSNAQQLVNTLTVTAPPSIAADYTVGIAGFGAQQTSSITGTATFVDDTVAPITDACDGTIANVLGKIAFIDRGTCEFGFKALEAQNAGAVVAVICNNVPGDGIPGLAAGAVGDMVVIPVVGMTYEDCQIIRVEAEGGEIDVTISYQCAPPFYPANVLWGRNTGEGDFANGLGDWTIDNSENACDSTWYYDLNGVATGSFTNFTIQAPTTCNGAMVFCSDFLDNGGLGAGSIGSGAGGCVAPTGFGYLTSPLIDMTQFTVPAGEALFLEFSHAYRHFGSVYTVEFSTNGVTYSDGCNPAPLATTNGPNVNEDVRIPVPAAMASANNLSFRFGMNGNYYYWIVDDVRLAHYPSGSDVSMNAAFYAVPPQYKTPMSQGIDMPFTLDLVNTGDQTATDITLGVEIFDPAGTEVFNNSFSEDTLDLMNCDTDTGQNNLFPFAYTDNNLSLGTYTGNYVIDVPNDVNLDNNTVPFFFNVSENTYQSVPSQEDINADPSLLALETMTDGSIFALGASSFAPFYGAANAYHIVDATDWTVGNITFGVVEQDASGFVDIQLLKLPNGDADLSGAIEPAEREIVGATSVVLDTVMNKLLMSVPLWKADGNGIFTGEPVELESNTTYLLAFVTRPLVATTQINLLSYNASLPINNLRNFDASATSFAYTGIYGNTRAAGTYFEPLIDGTAADFASTSLDRYGINQLYSEMELVMVSGTNDLNKDLNVSAYPNPTTNDLFVDVNLENTSDVRLELFDIQGKLVLANVTENVQSTTVKLATANLASGSYTLKVISDEGFVAKNIIIE